MKTIVYGRERTVKKLTGLLENEGIEVKIKPEGNYDIADWQAENDFDLAIVDSCTETAESACQNIRETGNMPVALLIDPKNTDWNKLIRLDADCYIPETKENTELAARLRAVLRRYSYRDRTGSRAVSVN